MTKIRIPTHLRAKLRNLGVADAEVDAIYSAIRADERIVSVKVYADGWVANCYRWDAPGQAAVLGVVDGRWQIDGEWYDRKRSYGSGPLWVARSARGGRLASG